MTASIAGVNPRVSVVIPHFNRSDLLEMTVASVLASTEQSFEIIIVDDGSDPQHSGRAAGLTGAKVRFLSRRGEPKGPSRCRNQGVAASTAEFIVFLDSDDVMAAWCLEQRLSAAESNRDADMWVFPVMLFDQRPGDRSVLWNRMDNGVPAAVRFIGSDPPWHTSSPLWRRAAFLEVGGFNENMFYGDDSDLHMRALVEGRRARLFQDVIPDVFVRRSSAERVTNSPSQRSVSNRPGRLREGTRYLRSRPELAPFLRAWEGRYFAEAEYYLFNEVSPRSAVMDVLAQWAEDFRPLTAPSWATRAYFEIALRSKKRVYLALRLARRIAMKVLPPEYFRLAPDLETFEARPETVAEIRRRLQD
ncbi:MAG: glycosyltransferase family A protein [Gemmatimonadales bacterium]